MKDPCIVTTTTQRLNLNQIGMGVLTDDASNRSSPAERSW